VNGEQAKPLLHYGISLFCYIGKPACLSMPNFLAGCHYNDEEISQHFNKKKKKDIGRSKLMATSLQPVKS
jgi:hypothetical protein